MSSARAGERVITEEELEDIFASEAPSTGKLTQFDADGGFTRYDHSA